MFAVRSAIVLVALSYLISPSAVSASSTSPRGAGCICFSRAADCSISQLDIAPVTESARLSRKVYRRSRLKAVLEEETDRKLEEVDLGLVPVPRTLGLHTSIAISSPFYPRTSRLRC
jgi:hypothetical protein